MLRRSRSRRLDIYGSSASDVSAKSADELWWCREVVTRVGDLEAEVQALSDTDLAVRTTQLRLAAEAGMLAGDLMPDAFATVREAAKRALGLRHHDVQIMGGAAIQHGLVTQMRTGEGKTLTATLPAYLNALYGGAVHVMTANEYLARRDAEWMRPVYNLLGLRTGLIDKASQPNAGPERARAYQADVTYGEAEEFCYDFLRDNLAMEPAECVQRGRACAIVDEADLIMIDGARLLPQITGPARDMQAEEGVATSQRYVKLAAMPMHAYLKGYERLMAMTGSATPDAASYRGIYGFPVLVVPTHRPVIRIDHQDVFCSSAQVKLAELVKEAACRHETGQPVLIGAGSVEQAAAISGLLGERDVSHQVLTAKNNGQEAAIIEHAAELGAVTVIAEMAGRGVDIVLGGPDAPDADCLHVADLGGLCVLGAGRYVNGRLETHLRGRAGRQGDPGESKLFAAFDDEAVLTILGASQAARTVKTARTAPAMSLGMVTREFDRGQARWAASAAEAARAAIKFDEMLDEQRDKIDLRRRQIFDSTDLSDWFIDLAARVPTRESDPAAAYSMRQARLGGATMLKVVRYIGLVTIDHHWREHLQEMDALLSGVGLRAIGRRSPLEEYRRDAAELFAAMITAIEKMTVDQVFASTPVLPAWLKSSLTK